MYSKMRGQVMSVVVEGQEETARYNIAKELIKHSCKINEKDEF